MGLKEASQSYGEKTTCCTGCGKDIYKSESKGSQDWPLCESCWMKICWNEKPLPKGYRKLSDEEKEEVKEGL